MDETEEIQKQEDEKMEQKQEEEDLESLLVMSKPTEARVLHLEDQLKQSRAENATTKKMFNGQAAQMQSYMQKLEQMQVVLLTSQSQPGRPPSGQNMLTSMDSKSPQLTRTPVVPKRRDPTAPFGGPKDAKKPRTEDAEVIPDSPPSNSAPEIQTPISEPPKNNMTGMD